MLVTNEVTNVAADLAVHVVSFVANMLVTNEVANVAADIVADVVAVYVVVPDVVTEQQQYASQTKMSRTVGHIPTL